ncbi:class I SAM-dependent methyltransferase [Streptomyces hoynatensis]|uniref:class I SAM-dependent methyltransferase n=1 Tax=Streptomyces hoynatensis TaxID=1141874 RepID=UPI001F4EF47C|nr:class I SAM-dependent methyltransferase [Streptomyces hoynatensis]
MTNDQARRRDGTDGGQETSAAGEELSLFADPRYAACYDAFFPWEDREDFHFYLPRVTAADAVLDVGCGTGMLLHHAREAGHAGRLVGLDPAPGMLERARRRTDVEWVRGDLRSVAWREEFDLVLMTGHAFQELVTDADLRAALRAVSAALAPGGSFAFETRNPALRGWERWDFEYSLAVPDPEGSGGTVRMAMQAEGPATPAPGGGTLVRAVTRLTGPAWPGLRTHRSAYRFLNAAELRGFLAEAGLEVAEQYGDFDGSPPDDSAPEIVTVARRA